MKTGSTELIILGYSMAGNRVSHAATIFLSAIVGQVGRGTPWVRTKGYRSRFAAMWGSQSWLPFRRLLRAPLAGFRSAHAAVLAVCILGALLSPLLAQTPAFSIYPMRVELEVSPGGEKTAAFEIRAAPSPTPERGRLVVSLTDWKIREDGSVTYAEPGSTERSASPWIIFSPSALSTEPGRSQLVRITVKVPEDTQPGVYRSGLFIQER